ncbi:hypothetical protein LguiA_025149 [Lonicera macranthoides]
MITIFLLLLMTHLGYSRSIRDTMDLISDGSVSDLRIGNLRESTVTCEPVYGFLPCTTNIWGQLFLILVYQYLLSLGERYVSFASSTFVRLHGPGILGGSLFHLLPTIPQLLLVLASGLSASTETAEQQAAMGMGLLAGSAVMMLTLVWGACVAFGSYDLSEDSTSPKSEHHKPLSLTGFGLTTDLKTRWTARLMLISMVPLIILQLTKMLNTTSGTRVIILVALIVTLSLLIANSTYKVFSPWILDRRYEYVTQKFVKDKQLTLLTSNGRPNRAVIKEIFQSNDKDGDKKLSRTELRALIKGMKLKEDGLIGVDDYVESTMKVFDIIEDDCINEDEFSLAISTWIKEARAAETNQDHTSPNTSGTTAENAEPEQQRLLDKTEEYLNFGSLLVNYLKATFQLLLGIAILAVLAMPYLKTVGNFSAAANIPQFFVPYVIIPFALNYRRAMFFINSAREKTRSSISLTLSEIYGSAFMNNMIGLTTFLSLVYARDLSWDVSAEVLVVLIICTTMVIKQQCFVLQFEYAGAIMVQDMRRDSELEKEMGLEEDDFLEQLRSFGKLPPKSGAGIIDSWATLIPVLACVGVEKGEALARLLEGIKFVRELGTLGCDGSILISSKPGSKELAEKDAEDNREIREEAYDSINKAKALVESKCPGVVSCADILAIAARDSVHFVVLRLVRDTLRSPICGVVGAGGPYYQVKKGRWDGRISIASKVFPNIPHPNSTIDDLLKLFSSKGLNLKDLVVLSGSHSIGFAHCKHFVSRLYNYQGTQKPDPAIDPRLLKALKMTCPHFGGNANVVAPFDVTTPFSFDNVFYQNLEATLGLLASDQALFLDPRTKPLVQAMALDKSKFFQDFLVAMDKLGSVGVKRGRKHGEKRKLCTMHM